ncbi:N-acyl homoserine lactonase family protein [Pluralibacter gergoviae]|nr:Zn-dependent hydrolase [Pluralibacter gergoviae]OUR00300.1 N-acyl homoserine lactonase family protein [Pluralibacter gergoviae]
MRLYLLYLGMMEPGEIPVPGYLIQTSDKINILVDTGWPRSFVNKPENPPGLTVVMRPEDVIHSRLAAIGLTPSEIDYVVCTHLDGDHSGNHDLFQNAEFIIQKEHYELAFGGHPRFAANYASWGHTSLRYRLIEGDVELLPGVTLIETSGHVPGHQSLLVRLPVTGNVLLAADAIMHRSMADAATREIYITDMDDESGIRRSTQKLADIAKNESAAFVIYGHDTEQWANLRLSPAFYD